MFTFDARMGLVFDPSLLKLIRFHYLQQNWQKFTVVGSLRDDIALSKNYCWDNGAPFFNSSTHWLKLIQNPAPSELHISIDKWYRFTAWNIDFKHFFKEAWLSFQSTKHNALLWQILYKVNCNQFAHGASRCCPTLTPKRSASVLGRSIGGRQPHPLGFPRKKIIWWWALCLLLTDHN